MGNTVSDYFTDEDLECELRTFFEEEEMWSIDFKALFKQIEDFNDIYLTLKIKNRIFYINKITCEVEEK
jgi:hypothetical protein